MRKSAADATSSTSCTASTSRKATKRKSDDVARDDEAIEGEQINKLEKELSMCKTEFHHVRDRLDEEKLLSSNLKKEVRRLKEDVVTDLEEQIRDANAELRTAKERARVLEEETLVQEQKKFASLTKKTLQEEEKVRVEIEKHFQGVVDMQTCNGIIHNLKNKLNAQEQSNQITMKKLEKDHEHAIQIMKEEMMDGAELTAEVPTLNKKNGFSGRSYTT